MNKEKKKQNDFEIKRQKNIKKRTQIEYKELPLIVLTQAINQRIKKTKIKNLFLWIFFFHIIRL